ncbi:MAG: nitroreductase/quinone reductase family protein [Acidimicrobiales bacterium]|nr:nitroreductase/quinone reductase family protein [Acidimicrobiales bacterium]
MNTVHRSYLKLSGGRKGWVMAGMPVLKLTTIGRLSGQPRTVMLTSPFQEGDTTVLVASRGGDDIHPAWYHNLCATPQVTVTTQETKDQPMNARVANAEERARIWPLITEKFSNYAGYQEKTDREIPLVVLTPVT